VAWLPKYCGSPGLIATPSKGQIGPLRGQMKLRVSVKKIGEMFTLAVLIFPCFHLWSKLRKDWVEMVFGVPVSGWKRPQNRIISLLLQPV